MEKLKWLKWMVFWVEVAVIVAIALDQRMVVRRYTVEAAEITAPVRLAVVTDFHGCDYGPGALRLLDTIAAESPDVILLVGDIYDDGLPWDASDALVTALAAAYPTYYVTGNHEYWTNEIDRILMLVSDAGVTVLDQSCAVLEVCGQRISLCGVPDPYAMVYAGAPDTHVQLARTRAQAEQGTFTLLMAHRPELIDLYAAAGFDLVVAGHAHGGQVRIPLLVNGLCAPNQGWLPDYAGGEYRVGDTTMIVSRGLSTQAQWYVPRIFNRPELVIVTVK